MVLRYKMLKIPLSLKFKAHKHAFLWLQENQEVIKIIQHIQQMLECYFL